MGQLLVKNYIHTAFNTKYRVPLIHEPVDRELHAYLGVVCKILECPPIKVGRYTTHIHILCLLSKKIGLMKLLEEVTSHTSKWVKTKGDDLKIFIGKMVMVHSV
jgi:putative transposase